MRLFTSSHNKRKNVKFAILICFQNLQTKLYLLFFSSIISTQLYKVLIILITVEKLVM